MRCATRQDFKTKGAAAREEIKTTGAFGVFTQPVEDCLAHPVRCGADAVHSGEGQGAAAPHAADNARVARWNAFQCYRAPL